MVKVLKVLLLALLVCCAGCRKDSHGSKGGGGSNNDPTVNKGDFLTSCGTVVNGELKNPVASKDGIRVTTEVLTPSQIIGTMSDGGKILIKLHGIKDGSSKFLAAATAKLKAIAGDGQAIFFKAGEDCTTTVSGGGVATVGSLFTLAGKSYAEELIASGYATLAYNDYCGGSLISNCYDSLQEDAPKVGDVLTKFLWKPEADKDGKLVVLVSTYNAKVVVNGETLNNTGASNGYGSTARGTRNGCAYGANPRVRVYTSKDEIVLFPNGQAEYVIPNGCQRHQF